ncbi:MAG: band 7 protein [Pseudopedobacter saltans]|uniref:Band 7 protein n=1 Tax=Pseudopedobacter saltans TaxID=151895 RepID=A0A2W5HDC5_9SPHI|nr:MAG: band 7 protein [Pseudopedobacter saltans]
MEKSITPVSGFLALLLGILLLLAGGYLFFSGAPQGSIGMIALGIVSFIVAVFLLKGIVIINPNHSKVCVFFGKYDGTIKANGLLFVNTLYQKFTISLRAENMESNKLKVNDSMGNPIEIAAVIVWQVKDTYRAAFEVSQYMNYVKVQSEAAIRHLASSFPYDNLENEKATITLREGTEQVTSILIDELNERLSFAGVHVLEARISHLAYAPEIASAMLQRQQATAIVAARTKIVEGAVGMVETALEMLSKKDIVHLDDDKKAAMVSNLMVVLCGEKAATPVMNTGTLYQ